jgi:hypothetical protein
MWIVGEMNSIGRQDVAGSLKRPYAHACTHVAFHGDRRNVGLKGGTSACAVRRTRTIQKSIWRLEGRIRINAHVLEWVRVNLK